MGVNHLWPILSPVKKHKSLDSLQGQTLAVDLSMWICESQAVKQMQGNVVKPFLRNLFFRVNHLLQLGIHLVFIIDGSPPQMKTETIQKRLNCAQKNNIGAWKKPHSRTRLNAFLRECCCLLECLGIPYLESSGEAESYCAFLNAEGIVDACLTDDGDAFLYGAKQIYRNFTMDSKDPHVETYNIKHIESQLNFNRNHLIAFALLVGCDYLPKGVPHVGVETTLKLFKALGDKDVLSRFQEWRLMKSSEFSNALEANVRDKALSLPEFPHKEIIKEFLVSKDKLPTKDLLWKRPNIEKFQEIAVQKLEWTQEYAFKKILPLVTKWTMLEIISVIPPKYHKECIVADKILKTRIQKHIPCFEIKWKPSDITDKNADKYISVEEQEMFTKCYPNLVEQYSQLQISKCPVKKKESRKKTVLVKNENMQPDDNLSLDFEKLSLQPQISESESHAKGVHHDPDFHIEYVKIPQKDTEFRLSCQSSSIDQQTENPIISESYKMTPVRLKDHNFISKSDEYFTSKKQTKESCYSTNNEVYTMISPLYDLSTPKCHNTTEENFENIFSPVFSKLHYQHLLSEDICESITSKEKPILNSFKLLSQSTPKLQNCPDTKEDESQCDPELVFCHRKQNSNKLNESLFLQATQVDNIDKNQKLQNIASDILSETFFGDTQKETNSSFSKDDSMQLVPNSLLTHHETSRSNENLKKDADNLAFVNASQQENYDISLSFCNQEASISFINISSDSSNLNESSSESDINSISINNDCVKQCNNQSSRINKTTKLRPDKKAPLIYNEYSPVKDSFKLTDQSQTANDRKEITKMNGIFKKKPNLLLDSSKLAPEEYLQKGNLMLDKEAISPMSFPLISDCSNESSNDYKSLLGLLPSDESNLISTTLSDQELLPYSSFENDSMTIKAVENDSNNTLHSFDKSYFGQFEIQTTFLNDSNENQNKY